MTEEAGHKEDHGPMNIKLLVYAIMNVIGLATGLYGYFVKPWAKVRLLVGVGSFIYLLISVIWLAVSSFLMTATTFRGTADKRKKLWLRSECFLPEAVYCVKQIDAVSGKEAEVLGEGHVQEWVDDRGRLLAEKFCRGFMTDLTSKITSKSE